MATLKPPTMRTYSATETTLNLFNVPTYICAFNIFHNRRVCMCRFNIYFGSILRTHTQHAFNNGAIIENAI